MIHGRNRVGWQILIFVFCLLVLAPAGSARAASPDYFVEAGKNGDGSESDPFGSIAEAVEEISEHGGKSILVRAGKYNEAFTLPKGVSLVGEGDRDNVWLKQKMRMEDGSEVQNLAFTERGGIIVGGGADVTIQNIHVKNVTAIGINAEPGDGRLVMEEILIEGARKGLYIQKGREIIIKDSEVSYNREEGADIRNQVSGSITESRFRNNKESGIEVILGASKISIHSNIVKDNGSSGIATQFLFGEDRAGDVRIEDNTIEGSTNYGIDCRIPGGGPFAGDYFLNSLRIEGNTYKGNQKGDIAPRCKVLTEEESRALAEKEAREQEWEAKRQAPLLLSETELSRRTLAAAQERKAYDEIQISDERERFGQSGESLNAALLHMERYVQEMSERSSFACFFLGRDVAANRAFRATFDKAESVLDVLEQGGQGIKYDENRRVFQEVLSVSRGRLVDMQARVEGLPVCQFSLLGNMTRWFAERRDTKRIVSEEEWHQVEQSLPGNGKKILLLGTLSWTPFVRNQVVEKGDEYLFRQIRDELRGYDTVVADIALPILNAADPVPAARAVRPVSLPSRLANIFSANNIRLLSVTGLSDHDLMTTKLLAQTEANLQDTSADVFGSSGKNAARILGEKTVRFFGYDEGKPQRLERILTEIAEARKSANALIVYVAWKKTASSIANAERMNEQRLLVERLIEVGADIVVGTGVSLPIQSEDISGHRVYYSLGDMFPVTESPDGFSAISIGFDQSGSLVIEERKGRYDGDEGVVFPSSE
ncbi:MAG: hypothetical protein QG606_262 [Patescibacteria group bacterium]|nr:hypothetical protein [Patescibacteria group bacterium]